MTAEPQRIRTEKLRWHSRRALLELDLVLQRFWQRQPDILGEGQAAQLERLLALEDHDLWDLLSGRRASTDPALRDMVARLRQPAGN
ncbi:MAG: succinate dehydrogenase assembly factor 2 [Sulfuritalea sp.]|nr:succinate dehydrogenase assembly factor 2 [Sulfuritalea sp.]